MSLACARCGGVTDVTGADIQRLSSRLTADVFEAMHFHCGSSLTGALRVVIPIESRDWVVMHTITDGHTFRYGEMTDEGEAEMAAWRALLGTKGRASPRRR